MAAACLLATAFAHGSVDVFIGTAGLGHVTPAATAPFGMVQAGPDTSSKSNKFSRSWSHASGYQHGDAWCWRFSQLHLSGTGCISFGNLGLMPYLDGTDPVTAPARFDKSTERGEPGYYATRLCWGDRPVEVEIAAREHAVAYRFVFPKGERAKLLVDLDWTISFHYNGTSDWRGCRITDCSSQFVSPTEMRGQFSVFCWNDYRVCFASVFSTPIVASRQLRSAEKGRGETWELDFGVPADGVLEVRLGLSMTTSDAAAANLAAEVPTFDFAAVRAAASAAWNRRLGAITLDPRTDPKIARSFESALYRTMMQPNLISDVGQPRRFSTFSLWDTFRAAHPLYTLIAPDLVDDFVNSMLEQYDRQGYLPIWALGGSENHCMIGHHSVPVIVDAYLKGFRGFDASRALAAIRDSLTRNHRATNVGTWGLTKEDWDVLDQYGYYPFDKLRGKVKGESVSRTLECAYDDACAARLCTALGDADGTAFFSKRAGNWRNVFDSTTGFMRGKDSHGKWREPFDPFALGGGPWNNNDFCEGNSWQYTWHVMHDPRGLMEAFGSTSNFLARLQQLFDQPPHKYAKRPTGDVTGLIGQYAHGNEPSHHTIYFLTLAGRRDLAAKYVSKVFATMYSPEPKGLCGNDDCGQMAAWYVFSALGFYPFDPCGGEYVLGAPQVAGASLHLANGKRLDVSASDSATAGTGTVKFNGRPLERPVLGHAELLSGGKLEF